MKILKLDTPCLLISSGISSMCVRVHRRQVEAVVDVEAALAELQHLGKELAVRPALVQVVLAGAEVVQAGGHAAHRRGLALADRVFRQRRVDAAVHVRIDHAGEGQPAAAVVDLLRPRHVDARRHLGHLAAGDGDVGVVHRVAVRAHDAHVLDQQVVGRVGSWGLLAVQASFQLRQQAARVDHVEQEAGNRVRRPARCRRARVHARRRGRRRRCVRRPAMRAALAGRSAAAGRR